MLEIEGRRIRVSRGDTARIVIELDGGEALEGTTALLTAKRRPGGAQALWEKRTAVSDGKVVLELDSRDTDHSPNTYWWDLRLLMKGERVQTPFEPERFEVVEAVGNV